MTSRPRSRPAPGAIALGLVLAAVLLVVVIAGLLRIDLVAGVGAVFSSMFPPKAATAQGQEIRNLYDIVFWIAAAIFLLVEGLIVWSVIRYRRRPGDNELPAQKIGRAHV